MRHDPRTPPPALRQPTSKIPGSFLLHSGNPGSASTHTGNPGSDFVRPKIPGSFPVHSEIPGSALVHSEIPGSSPVRPGPFFAPRRTYGEPQFPRWTGNEPGISPPCPDGHAANPGSGTQLRMAGRRTRDFADVRRRTCDKPGIKPAPTRRHCRDAVSAPDSRFGQHRQRGRYTRFVLWPAPVAGGAALSFRRPSSLPRVSRPWRLPRWSRPHRLPNSVRRWPL